MTTAPKRSSPLRESESSSTPTTVAPPTMNALVPTATTKSLIPPLRSPSTPIAILPLHVARSSTTLVVKQTDGTWLGRDFTIYDSNATPIYRVAGKVLSHSARRSFIDVKTGISLFELRRRRANTNEDWYLDVPAPSPTPASQLSPPQSQLDMKEKTQDRADPSFSAAIDPQCWANFNFTIPKTFVGHTRGSSSSSIYKPRSTTSKSSSSSSSSSSNSSSTGGDVDTITLSVRALTFRRLVYLVLLRGKKIMEFRKIPGREAPGVARGGCMGLQFGVRPAWEVDVARGVDLSLASLIAVILTELNPGNLSKREEGFPASEKPLEDSKSVKFEDWV